MNPQRVFPFKAPFSYETLEDEEGDAVYRIKDCADNAVCRTYLEDNAKILVNALNQAAA